jgi:hypothetical protein
VHGEDGVIALSESIKRDINNAFGEGHPIIVIGVTTDGEPTVSFRGTTQVLDDSTLAFWVRKPEESTLLSAIPTHPVVVLVYTDMARRRHYQFRGRARRADDEPTRTKVYESAHEFEQRQDPERKGTAVVVELTAVRGRGEDGPVSLRAD